LVPHDPQFLRGRDPASGFLVTLDQFENQMHTSGSGTESLSGISAQAHGRKDAFHRIRRAQMFPVRVYKSGNICTSLPSA